MTRTILETIGNATTTPMQGNTSPIQRNTPAIQRLLWLFGMAKGNPNMVNAMLQNNPMMQRVNQIIQENGGDKQRAFYALANQMGVNPEDVLSMLR